jgi:uncharacterized Fe-S cluster protein YjdI
MDSSGNRDYSNNDITVFWRPSKCIHATTCYRELIEVFNPRKRPWVNMQGAPTEKIIEVVQKCPTQALDFKWNDPARQQEWVTKTEKNNTQEPKEDEAISPVEIRLMSDGPIVISGKFRILNTAGVELRSMAIASLCRCGGSNQMPYCDGAHRKIDFKSQE